MRYLLIAAILLFPGSFVQAQSAESRSHSWPALGVETSVEVKLAQSLYNFTPDGDEGVWLQDFRKRWYYATISGICPGLGRAVGLGYDMRSSATFDKSTKLVVDGFQCAMSSIVTSDRPPSKKEIKARIMARAAEKRARVAEARAAKRIAK